MDRRQNTAEESSVARSAIRKVSIRLVPFVATAAELAEVGVAVAEVGHAERRRLFGETDAVTARKAAAALSRGLAPVHTEYVSSRIAVPEQGSASDRVEGRSASENVGGLA